MRLHDLSISKARLQILHRYMTHHTRTHQHARAVHVHAYHECPWSSVLTHTCYHALQGEQVRKAVFYVVLLGRQLNTRITKMCDLFRATIYPLPESRDEYERELRAMRQEIKDKT